MLDDFEDFEAYATHLAAEHRRLHECVCRIQREWIDAEVSRPAEVIPQVIEDLKSLRAELSHHFEEEESGGCLEEAVSRQPSFGREATRLEHEHPALLGHLDQLIENLTETSRRGKTLDDAKEDFRRFAKQLHDHESAENQVLERCFGVEVD